jgi:hypothetical protein
VRLTHYTTSQQLNHTLSIRWQMHNGILEVAHRRKPFTSLSDKCGLRPVKQHSAIALRVNPTLFDNVRGVQTERAQLLARAPESCNAGLARWQIAWFGFDTFGLGAFAFGDNQFLGN